MKRRHFLRLSQLMLASYLLTTSCRRQNTQIVAADAPMVVVIGSGLAGLAAAQRLQQEGYNVLILEARDRLGGRTWTSQQWEDAPVDLGASWIHGIEGNPLTELATKINTPLVETSYDSAIAYGVTGEPFSEAERQLLIELQTQIDQAIATAQDQDNDQSLQTLLDEALDRENQPLATQQFIDFLLNSTIEHEYAGSLAELSTQWFDESEVFEGEDAIFTEGYQVIVNYLAQDIPVKFNQVVTEINYSGDRPIIITDQDRYEADYVVLTVPLGVLKSQTITFIPELPTAKQTAIGALGVGVLNKCYLRFPEVFWSAEIDWLEQIGTERNLWTEWVNLAGVTGLPILLGFNAATQGKAIESWQDQAIVDSAIATLKRIFGDDIPDPIDYQITRWQADPFARGSYSFNAVGSTPEMRDRLAAALNDQLFFAGEATERSYFATAHGAYLSGLRAAQEILAL